MSNAAHYQNLARACESAARQLSDAQLRHDCLELARQWRVLGARAAARGRLCGRVADEAASWDER